MKIDFLKDDFRKTNQKEFQLWDWGVAQKETFAWFEKEVGLRKKGKRTIFQDFLYIQSDIIMSLLRIQNKKMNRVYGVWGSAEGLFGFKDLTGVRLKLDL